MDSKVCKKCGRNLPEKYKYKYCESCRTQKAEKAKTALKSAGAIAGTVASIALVVVTKGKINPKK